MGKSKITLIGLGQMGEALVYPYLDAGQDVTVWNRTAQRAEPLVAKGAKLVESLEDAIISSDLIIVCLADYDIAGDLLRRAGIEALLAGKTLVHLTTGNGAQAEEWATWAKQKGIDYLDGAIMDYPTKIGHPECLLLISGEQSVYETYATQLTLLGRMTFVGAHIANANHLDGALLTMYYGNTFSLMQSLAMLMGEGVDIETLREPLEAFKPVIDSTWKRTLDHVLSGDYSGNEASINVHLLGIESLMKRAESAGVEHKLLSLFNDYIEKTEALGFRDDELPAVFELFRPKKS